MRRFRRLFVLIAIGPFGFSPAPPAHAAPRPSWTGLTAFVRHDNVWIAHADGSGGQQLTDDGTGTRVVHQKQVTYAYLTWSPNQQHLLVTHLESKNTPGQP